MVGEERVIFLRPKRIGVSIRVRNYYHGSIESLSLELKEVEKLFGVLKMIP